MEVKPGYKHTEVGQIPEDWEVASVGSIARFTSGSGISIANLERKSTDFPIPVFGGNGLAGYTRTPLVREKTVVIGRVGQKCGEVYITEGPAWISDNALFPKRMLRDCDVAFFGLALQAAALNNVRNRNDLPLVTQLIVHATRLAWPSKIDEQRAIATKLREVDALLDGLDRLIAKKRDLKQAAVQQLLTGRTRLPGFINQWKLVRLTEIGELLKGKGITKNQGGIGALPCIRYGELYTAHNDIIRNYHSWISPRVASTACLLKQGDILFAGSGETKEDIGKCAAFVDDIVAYAGGDIVILRPHKANSTFLGYLLNTAEISRQKTSRGQGDAIVHINTNALATIRFQIPNVDEQTAIAKVLTDMDAEISALEQRREKTRALKQAMMQELLTGKTRLI